MIIIVDDDPLSSKITALSIQKGIPDCICVVFNNPITALEKISQMAVENPSSNPLLLIDINMPEMNGWEFIDSLNQIVPSSKNFKGMILSSSVDPADIDKAKTYPRIINFLTKPFTLDTARIIKLHLQ